MVTMVDDIKEDQPNDTDMMYNPIEGKWIL